MTITSAGASSSFMKLVEVDAVKLPFTVAPGGTWSAEFVYQVTTCANGMEDKPWPIPLTVRREWGTQRVDLTPPDDTLEGDDADDAPRAWHVARASYACDW
ncbi:hypothetical protein ACIBG8_47180 [Nonomuraea sp. NPDC050556]|uniref:hypothetical protein n=1 Tax=Nonomuraea sp. NPDC050556 TaxID=3364369 RepID=UPI00378C4015